MTVPTPAVLIVKFLALLANLSKSKENLKRVETEYPLPNISTMALSRQLAYSSWAPYTESSYYHSWNYPEGSDERTYAENFMIQRKAREPVNRIAYWIRELYHLKKMMNYNATESQFLIYSKLESIENLIQLLEINVSQEDLFDLVMAIANTPFDWKLHGINTDEYDEAIRRKQEFLESYNTGVLTAHKVLRVVPQ